MCDVGINKSPIIHVFQASGGGSGPPPPGVEIPSGAFVAKITNDDREEEMEENMQQVGGEKADTKVVSFSRMKSPHC